MIFVDSNVPMYLVGQPHRNRDLLEKYLRDNSAEIFATSAEVYQEIVHRYVSLDRRQAIADGYRLLDAIVAHVFAIEREDVEAAKEVALEQRNLSGRDCLHVAVMERHGVRQILTCDRAFQSRAGISCLP